MEPADIDGQLKDETLAMLSGQYPSESYAENRLLSELLVALGADDVVPKTIGLLRASTNQTEQMHYLYVLRNVRRWVVDGGSSRVLLLGWHRRNIIVAEQE